MRGLKYFVSQNSELVFRRDIYGNERIRLKNGKWARFSMLGAFTDLEEMSFKELIEKGLVE